MASGGDFPTGYDDNDGVVAARRTHAQAGFSADAGSAPPLDSAAADATPAMATVRTEKKRSRGPRAFRSLTRRVTARSGPPLQTDKLVGVGEKWR